VSRGMVLRIYTVGGAPEIAPEHSRPKTSSKARTPQATPPANQTAAVTRN
jgi:hypothetical protein